jgi:hypothetical protein
MAVGKIRTLGTAELYFLILICDFGHKREASISVLGNKRVLGCDFARVSFRCSGRGRVYA